MFNLENVNIKCKHEFTMFFCFVLCLLFDQLYDNFVIYTHTI